MPEPLVATQVVHVIRRELALLNGASSRAQQLLEVADTLLERAAVEDELRVYGMAELPVEMSALVSQVVGPVDLGATDTLQDDITTSFQSAQPPSMSDKDVLDLFQRHTPAIKLREVRDVCRLPGGFSKELVRATVAGEAGDDIEAVIRKVTPGRRADGLAPEYAVLSFVAGSAVPVPRPLWLDENGLDSPAFATTALDGRTAGNVWGWTEPPSRTLIRDLGRAMGALHALDPTPLASAPLPPLRSHSDHLAAIAERGEVLDGIWRTGTDAFRPVFERILDWLRANAPRDEVAPVLVHGDFGLHNALATDDHLVGLLDWERAHLGNPAEDIAYLKPSIDSADAWRDFEEQYAAGGGPPLVTDDIAYFTVWQDLWRAVSSYRIRAKFLADPTLLSDAIAGLLMTPRFLAGAAAGVVAHTRGPADWSTAAC